MISKCMKFYKFTFHVNSVNKKLQYFFKLTELQNNANVKLMAYPLLFSIIEHLFGTESMSVFIFSCSISFHLALIPINQWKVQYYFLAGVLEVLS